MDNLVRVAFILGLFRVSVEVSPSGCNGQSMDDKAQD